MSRQGMFSTQCRACVGRHQLRALLHERRGGLMVEAIVSLMVFSLVGTAVLTGLSTMHRSGAQTESQSIAENIARNQMEYVFTLPYQAPLSTYPSISTPSGYSVTATAEWQVGGDPNIEKVVLTVHYGGRDMLTLETLRVKG